MKPIIEFKNVSFFTKSKEILKDISFSVNRGENISLIGKSNVGKSLLFKILCGLAKPNKGKIFILGKNIYKCSETERFSLQKEIGLLFQNNALFDDMNCIENIIFPLLRRSFDKKEAIILAKEILKNSNLENIETLYPHEISGGMKKRVAIARMMICKPQIYLFDDPNAGLDPITSAKIYSLIKKTQSKNNTSLIISQDLSSIFSITNRILMLNNQNLVFDGTQKELSNIKNPEIREFLHI